MQRTNDVTDHGVSFDSTDLLFDGNQTFYSEFEGFPEFKSNSDFSNQSLTMEDLKIPFDTNEWDYNGYQNQAQWDQNYPNGSYNTNTQQLPGEMLANRINSFQNSQEYQDFSTNQNPSFQPQDCHVTDQTQILQVPQTYDNKRTNITPPNSDYYSGNTSTDSSPPRSSNQSTSSPFTDNSIIEPVKQQNRIQPTNPPRHNLGNLPNGLMKALTTVLTQTNNLAFKQLVKSQETTTTTTTPRTTTSKRKITRISSKPEPKKAPLIVPIQKSGLTNKPSLEEVRRKKAERMIKNREAALQSRKRKLEEQAVLEDSCRDLQDRNVQLEKQVSFLEGKYIINRNYKYVILYVMEDVGDCIYMAYFSLIRILLLEVFTCLLFII